MLVSKRWKAIYFRYIARVVKTRAEYESPDFQWFLLDFSSKDFKSIDEEIEFTAQEVSALGVNLYADDIK